MTPKDKRMWTRRAIRAGWLLAPVLSAPMKMIRLLFGTPRRAITTFILAGIVTGIGGCISNALYLASEATPELLAEKLKPSWCLKDYVPRIQASTNMPITVKQLKNAEDECVAAIERGKIIDQQRAVFSANQNPK